ncbi:MAG: RNA methyltransferase [Cyanobacteriota bacterium]|nr:RNA methyltransferase [Cyanobacteriota bacterium]
MLTSLQNPLVKQMRKLRSRKERQEQQRFLLEGTHALEVFCEFDSPLAVVCATPDWIRGHAPLWEKLARRSEQVEEVSPQVCRAIATTVNPDGVVATVVRGTWPRSPQFPLNLGLVVERLQDPGNLGTIIRTSAATEVGGLWLSDDSVDLHHPKVLRASVGEWFRLPMQVSSELGAVIAEGREVGMQIVATTPTAKSTYWEIEWTKPTLILLGNEAAGLSQKLRNLADREIRIPVGGGVESLNVAIATALLLYEVQRQRLGPKFRAWNLNSPKGNS